jgi:hypothetical protein
VVLSDRSVVCLLALIECLLVLITIAFYSSMLFFELASLVRPKYGPSHKSQTPLTTFGEQRHLVGMAVVGKAVKLVVVMHAATMHLMKIPSTNRRSLLIRNLLLLRT